MRESGGRKSDKGEGERREEVGKEGGMNGEGEKGR